MLFTSAKFKLLLAFLVLSFTIGTSNVYSAPLCHGTDASCQHNCESPLPSCTAECCQTKRLRGQVRSDLITRLQEADEAKRCGQLEIAATCYKYVLQEDPRNTEALYGVGRLAEQNGQLDQALYFYRLAAVNDPNNTLFSEAVYSAERQLKMPVLPITAPSTPRITVGQDPCPNLCVANKKTKTSTKILKFLGKAAYVGAVTAAAAARSGGLHCPICNAIP